MWVGQCIFRIYPAIKSWNIFLQTIGILSFLVAVASFWLSYKTEQDKSQQILSAKREEKIDAALENQEKILLEHIAKTHTFEEILTATQRDVDNLQNQLWRLTAQVQQTDAEAIMLRKINLIENKLTRLEAIQK
jgi:hypothetical protein